jgi:hypothetical protein
MELISRLSVQERFRERYGRICLMFDEMIARPLLDADGLRMNVDWSFLRKWISPQLKCSSRSFRPCGMAKAESLTKVASAVAEIPNGPSPHVQPRKITF